MAQNLSAREILEKLVSFPTVSRESNLALIDWVEAYLASHGVQSHRVYNDSGDKAGIFANIGPEAEGGVILSGHTDVVPIDGQDWATDPFTVVEKDGRLYGRGTCDMKGFDAIALAAVPKALAAGVKRPLQIALSYDEEVGCLGAPRLIAEMVKTLPRARAAIIGEPTEMEVVTGNKGGIGIETIVHGFEVHSSLMHTGVNAVMTAARLIDWANQQNAASMQAEPSAIASLFEPPWTSAHVGTITGGTAENITARKCRFVMTFRPVPDETGAMWRDRYLAKVRAVEAEISAIRPEAWIETNVYFQAPGLNPEADGAAETLVRRLSGDNATHAVSYATEAGQFQEAGYSAVICGPGNIEQAHQPNEWLSLEEFDKGIAFIDRVIEDLAR
jgi:acetylornithine deacetylase